MNIDRNTVREFQLASVGNTVGERILRIGTSAPGKITKVRVTDIKAVCAGTARTFKVMVRGGYTHKPLNFTLQANSTHNFTFEVPYTFNIVASSGVDYSLVASASGAGVDYVVCGYTE